MMTMNSKRSSGYKYSYVLIAAAVSLLAACGRQEGELDGHLDGAVTQAPLPGGSPQAGTAAQSPEQAAIDAAISAEIKAKFAADSTLGPLGIEVRTREGLVELVGKAPDASVRDHATRVAATVKNVLSVDNHMAVPRG